MKTLFISHSYLAGNGGGVYASRLYINLFSELSETMTLLYPWKEGQDPQGIKKGIQMIPVEDNRSDLRKFLELFVGKVHRFEKTAKKYIDKTLIDTVIFDNSVTSSRLVSLFKKAGIRTITIHHNYQIEYLKGDGNPLTLPLDLFWTWIYEGKAVRESDLNIALTSQDVILLRSHYYKNANFQVLGVYENYNNTYKTKGIEFSPTNNNHKYVITGYLGYRQTENSLLKWVAHYYPLLKKEDPLATLVVAGRSPSRKLANCLSENNIVLIDSPVDMTPILQNANYYICPTDRGGGLKLRIMDGLKAGLPVITHQVSSRGYELLEREGLVYIYNDDKSFVSGLRNMKELNKTKEEISQKYLERFGYQEGVMRLKEIL